MTRKILLLCFILLGLYYQNYTEIFTDVRALEVTPDTIVELNDVVKLNYTLWIEAGDPVEQQNGTVWVHDPDDPNAPSELYEQFPDLFVPPNLGFMENILGMKARTFKTFDILYSSNKAFNNATDPFYHHDLTYQVYLEDILLDASVLPLTLFDIPFLLPLFVLIVFLTFIIIFFRIKRFNKAHNILGSKTSCHSCGNSATVKCGNPSCHTIYCKDCFINNVHCTVCNSNKMIPLT
ncbi:MAG: hypothetical protein ACXAC6_12860 [Candidatus Hodarchaeales archaeon]|jgi:hypothetical protein